MIWLKALLFTLFVPGTTLALVPYWILASEADGRLSLGVFRWLGLLPFLAGVAGLASCYAAFAMVGRGTPSPLDPPRTLVAVGLYRFLRNPIYVSAVLYEEPTLRRRVGPSDEAYWAAVPRWVPQRPRTSA